MHDHEAGTAAQAEYRRLDERGEGALQDKLRRQNSRAACDTSIPAPEPRRDHSAVSAIVLQQHTSRPTDKQNQ